MPKNMAKNDVALYVLKALKSEGIETIFLVPGSKIEPFIEAAPRAEVKMVVAAHEGGAAYMADGYARATQSIGVCVGLGGPGVTNMATAIAAAYADRSPVLVLSSGSSAQDMGNGVFQDSTATGVDDLEIMRPMTAWAQRVPTPILNLSDEGGDGQVDYSQVKEFLQEAIRTMGPVENRPAFLSIPNEVLTGEPPEKQPIADYKPQHPSEPIRSLDTNAVQQIPDFLKGKTRIAILAGNGCVRSQAHTELQAFAEKFSIPVVTTLRAKGVLSEDTAESPMSFGYFGLSGTLQANKVVLGSDHIPKAELLIVLGGTLNQTNTYGWHKDFPAGDALVRIDINPNARSGKDYDETLIVGDVKEFLYWIRVNEALFGESLHSSQAARKDWIEDIRKTPYFDHIDQRESNAAPIEPARVVVELRSRAPQNTVLVVDSGAHSYYSPHHWQSYGPNEFLMLTNTGPMGYGVSVGIGAKLARPDRPCVAIVGDGSLLMHGMEIKTAVRYRAPLVIVVINNSALGNIYLRARDEDWLPEALEAAEIPTIDCVAFAHSLGADGIRVDHPAQLSDAFTKAFEETRHSQRPFLVDIRCRKDSDIPNELLPQAGVVPVVR
ncbi:MAG: thiamine pyrophosphate-binding protein [Phormidesmis sp.]